MKNFTNDNEQLQDFRDALITRFGEPAYRSWMFDLNVEKNGDDEVEISTESPLRRDTLVQRFKPAMHDEWNRLVAPTKKFSISVRQKEKLSRHAQSVSDNSAPSALGSDLFNVPGGGAKGSGRSGNFEEGKTAKKFYGLNELASPFDPRSTFDSFAIDDTNRMAHAAARQVFVEGAPHNLIYIHGRSGIGKTHLLHAIGHEWRRRNGEGTCAYLTHSDLTNGCVDAVWSNSILSLHKDLLSQRLLLIDDIHLLGGKNRTQQEVLNMVNAFISSGRQLVIAGEAAPGRLGESDIHARLTDRLAGGLAVPVEPGGVELRNEVLKMRAEGASTKCVIEASALDYIAEHFPHSMREAIGALNQLLLVYGEAETTVGRSEAEMTLRSRLTSQSRVGTMEDGVVAAAEAFGLTVEDIKGRAQPQRIVKARHAFVYVSREVLKESFPRIAGVLGRDHTTAMSSYRRAQALIERNEEFRTAVEKIRIAVCG